MKKYFTISFIFFIWISCGQIVAPATQNSSNTNAIPKVDGLVSDFMKKYNVPGMSVAISKDGKIVYAKGYGFANQTTGEKVAPTTLFRIASVSKPFTSVAIMQLLQEGRLSLEEKVFGDSGILKNDYGKPPYGKNISRITIHELLQHRGGGWSNNDKDPMFTNPSFSASELISWTLNNLPLENDPGEKYAYSNFGYCVLGRVIEKITGMSYENYVKKNILQKVGVTDMQIGGNTLADKKPNEVVYYGQGDENPYAYNITRMDSHGGWIASAPDLLRFLFCVDGFPTIPDILNDSTIKIMTTASTANKNYACGWAVNTNNNWWHSGSLPGTGTEMVRAHNGFCWAILTNTRTWKGNFAADMDELIWYAVNDTTIQWKEQEKF